MRTDWHNTYISKFAENDLYETKDRGRKPLSPSLHFYPRLARIIIRSANMAKRGEYKSIEWANSSLAILDALERSGIKIHAEGLGNIGSFDGPAVFISNHMSTLETVVLPGFIQPVKEVTFVVKQELMEYPYFKYVLGSRDPIVVGRSNPREDLAKVMNEGFEKLTSGRSIIIFPQRTRSPYFDAESFNSLGIKLAKKAGVHVVPLALVTDAWSNGSLIKDAGKMDTSKLVRFSFGKPFKVQGSGAQEHQAVLDFIRTKLTEWNRLDLIPEK